VVVDEGGQEALLALPAAPVSAAPASTTGKLSPAAITPSSYYYAWVNVEELGVSGASVESLRLESESLGWLRAEDTVEPSQLLSPYNWMARFTATGAAVTAGSSTCKYRGSLKLGMARSPAFGPSPLKASIKVTVKGGTAPYTGVLDYGDGSYNSLDNSGCNSLTQIFNHEYFNIGPPVALYRPQAVVSDRNGRSKTKTGALKTYMGRFSPKDPNTPIVIIGGIGTTRDNPDYQKLVDVLHGLGYNYVYVVDWAPKPESYDLDGIPVSLRHIPYLAVMETQRQLVEKLGTDQPFIAIALSGGGVVMRFLIEHRSADVIDPRRDILHNEGWDPNRSEPWYGDGKPDVAPCKRERDLNECGGIGPAHALRLL